MKYKRKPKGESDQKDTGERQSSGGGGRAGKTKNAKTSKPDKTGQTATKSGVRKHVAARVKAKNPNLKGKKLQTRIKKQTRGAVNRRRERGMTVVNDMKKKKKK